MPSGIPPVGITQNERFLSCDSVLLGEWYVSQVTSWPMHAVIIIYSCAEPRLWLALQAHSWQSKLEDVFLSAVRI
jgi:hypothetical protein